MSEGRPHDGEYGEQHGGRPTLGTQFPSSAHCFERSSVLHQGDHQSHGRHRQEEHHHGHAQQQGAGPGQELLGRPPIGPQLPRPHGQGRDQRRPEQECGQTPQGSLPGLGEGNVPAEQGAATDHGDRPRRDRDTHQHDGDHDPCHENLGIGSVRECDRSVDEYGAHPRQEQRDHKDRRGERYGLCGKEWPQAAQVGRTHHAQRRRHPDGQPEVLRGSISARCSCDDSASRHGGPFGTRNAATAAYRADMILPRAGQGPGAELTGRLLRRRGRPCDQRRSSHS